MVYEKAVSPWPGLAIPTSLVLTQKFSSMRHHCRVGVTFFRILSEYFDLEILMNVVGCFRILNAHMYVFKMKIRKGFQKYGSPAP